MFEPYIERKSWILENGGTRASYGFRIRRAASSISPVIQDINGVDASLERDFKGLPQPRPSSPPSAFRGGARKKERRADSASRRAMRGSPLEKQRDNNFIRSAGGPWRAEKSTWAKSRNKESPSLSLWERWS